MNCNHCGKPVEPGNRFCLNCGQPLPEQTTASGLRKKKNVLALVMSGVSLMLAVLLVLSLTGVIGAASAGTASKKFSTPEDAIKYFVEHMTAGDWDGALKACAINEIAENYDYEFMMERLNALDPKLMCLPVEYKEFVEYNRASVRAMLLKQMAWLTFSVTLPEKYEEFIEMSPIGYVVSSTNEEDIIDDVVGDMDPAAIAGLKLKRIDSHELLTSSQNEKAYDTFAETYDADSQTSRVVLYEYDGDYYVGGFMLLEYNGHWLISELGEWLIGSPRTGALVEVAGEDEYEKMLE